MDVVGERNRERGLEWMYGASAFITCVLVEFWPGSLAYRLAKVIPMLLLSTARFRDRGDHFSKYVGFGLFASFLGDVMIDSSFIAGLGAFLVAHVFYLGAMGLPGRTTTPWLAMIPALGYGALMFGLLVASGRAPAELRLPVTIYMAVISTMLGRALGRAFLKQHEASARIFLVGAILFAISDSLIGIRRWLTPVPHVSVLIMATYYAGQWGIFRGSDSASGSNNT